MGADILNILRYEVLRFTLWLAKITPIPYILPVESIYRGLFKKKKLIKEK